MSDPVHRFRMAMAQHLGRIVTPEVAAKIEAEAFHEPDCTIHPALFLPQQCGSLTFRVERLSVIRAEMQALHDAHWSETEGHRHELGLEVDYDEMALEERRGTMIQFTARCGEQLVGNFRLYLRRSRHTKTPLALEDTLYLAPEHRRGRNAKQLVLYARACLNRLGYFEFRATVKKANPAAGRLLEHLGFQATGTEYVFIDKEPADVH